MIDYDETIRLMVDDWTRELEAIYDKVERIDDSNVFKVDRNGKVGVVTQEDYLNENFPPEYDSIEVFLDHHCCFLLEKDGKFKYHNSTASTEWFDEIIVPDYIGWIKVRKGNQWGWIDRNMCFTSDRSLANEYIIQREKHHSANIFFVTREIIDQWNDGNVEDYDVEYIRP